MRNSRLIAVMLTVSLLGIYGCTEKSAEGRVVSVPASIPLSALTSNKPIGKINFIGKYIKVKLTSGEVVDALATEAQMSDAFSGKGKATLEKTKEGEWKVTGLTESVQD